MSFYPSVHAELMADGSTSHLDRHHHPLLRVNRVEHYDFEEKKKKQHQDIAATHFG